MAGPYNINNKVDDSQLATAATANSVAQRTSDGGLNVTGLNTSGGNVGINTSSATSLLQIAGSSGYTVGNSGRATQGLDINSPAGGSGLFGGAISLGVGGAGRAAISAVQGSADNDVSTLAFFIHGSGTGSANSSEVMRIDSSGNVLVGTTNGFGARLFVRSASATAGDFIAGFGAGTGTPSLDLFVCDATGASTAASAARMQKNNTTGRSLNAAGTVNASGADYAEYMTKCGDFEIAKGDIVGINSDGKLTNVFADAVSFCVKSTDPSYVGGDVWGSEDAIGSKPQAPTQQVAEFDEEGNETQSAETDKAFAKRQAQYKADLADFESRLEAARQKVDRIAFAGQVPVNVLGAVAGQYIVPTDEGGAIKGIAKDESEMTLGDYMRSVGKVITVKEDGRAFIIVKVA